MERIPLAKHGRWYTRDPDDPIDGIPDTSPAVQGAADAAKLVDDEPED